MSLRVHELHAATFHAPLLLMPAAAAVDLTAALGGVQRRAPRARLGRIPWWLAATAARPARGPRPRESAPQPARAVAGGPARVRARRRPGPALVRLPDRPGRARRTAPAVKRRATGCHSGVTAGGAARRYAAEIP